MNQTTITNAKNRNHIETSVSMIRLDREQAFTLKAFMAISSMITALWFLTG
ncbi:MAG: hypothetical protein AAF353_14330 [Pseudomonadota bacterium]